MKGTESKAASRLYAEVMEYLITREHPSDTERAALTLLQGLGALVCDDAHDAEVLALQAQLDTDREGAIAGLIGSIAGWQ